MARRRAEASFFALLPKEFRTDEYKPHFEPCIGIIAASVLKGVETSGRFSWNGVSIPYKTKGSFQAVLRRAHTEFRAFDIDTFIAPKIATLKVFALYRVLYKSAESVAESVAREVEQVVFFRDTPPRKNWFLHAEIAVPDPRAGMDIHATRFTFALEPSGPLSRLCFKRFKYEEINKTSMKMNYEDGTKIPISPEILLFTRVSNNLYNIARDDNAEDESSSNAIREYIEAKKAMVVSFQTTRQFQYIVDTLIFFRDYEILLDTIDMPPNDEYIALRKHVGEYIKRLYAEPVSARNLGHPTMEQRFPITLFHTERGPDILQLVATVTPSLLIDEEVLSGLAHVVGVRDRILEAILSVDVFPVKHASNDRIGDFFSSTRVFKEIFELSHAISYY
jgi:hypothetical protein